MRRGILTIVLAAAVLVSAQPAGAFSFLDRAYGTPQLGLSARARAMGGAGAAMSDGVFSLVDNPGNLVLLRGNRAQFTGAMARASENRLVPLFDTFDSFVDETAVAVNDNGYGDLQGGVVLDHWGSRGVIVSGGVFTRYDPRYDYFDELRTSDSSDTLRNNKIIKTDGTLRTATLGVALPFGDGSGLGVAVNYYFGTLTNREALVSLGTSDYASATDAKLERKLDGFSVTVGANVFVDERLRVGASIETKPMLNDDYTTWANGVVTSAEESSGDLELPMRLQGGLTYRPRNTFNTTFAADVVYTPWSEIADHLNPDQKLQDTWEGRFGLEHVFYNNIPGRVGFRYGQSYAMDEADRVAFTFGFGYLVEQFKIDLAAEVGKSTTRQDPIRPRTSQGAYVGLGQDHVDDTLFRVSLGLDYGF